MLPILRLFSLILVLTLSAIISASNPYHTPQIHGYHFHTYFFQQDEKSVNDALKFRALIQEEIDSGNLAHCRLNIVYYGPYKPHPFGQFETCCNRTSMSEAVSFFMQNHGNLSILLHPLTRWEVLDHSTRAMFLGLTLPLDMSYLVDDLGDNVDLCLPLPRNFKEEKKREHAIIKHNDFAKVPTSLAFDEKRSWRLQFNMIPYNS